MLFLGGLCHVSELTDGAPTENMIDRFSKGDKVLVRVLAIDPTKRKISLGMKPSYFTDWEGFKGKDEATEAGGRDDSIATSESVDNNTTSPEELLANDSKSVLTDALPARRTIHDLLSTEVTTKDIKAEDEQKTTKEAKKPKQSKSLSTSPPRKNNILETQVELLASPNNSYLWIKNIAAALANNDGETAKTLCQKALKVIDPRFTNEKWNVWINYVKITREDSSREEFTSLCDTGLTEFDAEKVSLFLAELFEAENNFEEADRWLKKANKSCSNQSRQCWIKRAALRFRFASSSKESSLADEARRLIFRSAMKTIPEKEQPHFLMDFARLECDKDRYSCAVPEKGQTIIENLLTTFPRRSDIWLQAIDIEKKLWLESGFDKKRPFSERIGRIRTLFKKVIAMDFSARVMKLFFRKWMELEEKYGDATTVQQVRECAKEFVKTLTNT